MTAGACDAASPDSAIDLRRTSGPTNGRVGCSRSEEGSSNEPSRRGVSTTQDESSVPTACAWGPGVFDRSEPARQACGRRKRALALARGHSCASDPDSIPELRTAWWHSTPIHHFGQRGSGVDAPGGSILGGPCSRVQARPERIVVRSSSRVLQEEAQHLPRSVRPGWIGVRTLAAAARPGVAAPVHDPELCLDAPLR